MRITDLLKKESISLNRELASKSDAIDALIELHEKAGNLNDKEAYKKEILAREAQGSTAVETALQFPMLRLRQSQSPAFPQSPLLRVLTMSHWTAIPQTCSL